MSSLQQLSPTEWNAIAVRLKQQGRVAEAISTYQQLLEAHPQSAEGHYNLGLAWQATGQFTRAVASLHRATELRPEISQIHFCLGNALLGAGEADAALHCYERAIQLAPQDPQPWYNGGNTLLELGNPTAAIYWFQQALSRKPDDAAVKNNLGNAYLELGELTLAANCYAESLELDPLLADAAVNLGNALKKQGRLEQAIENYQRAISLRPQLLEAYTNLGNVYKDQGRLDAAADCYRQVALQQPTQPLQHLRLAALCPAVFDSRHAMDRYHEQLRAELHRLRKACAAITQSDIVTSAVEAPFNLQFHHANVRTIKEEFAALFEGRFQQPKLTVRRGSHQRIGHSSRKIRIGMVVTRGHEGIFTRSMRGVLEKLDPQRFQIAVFAAQSGLEQLRQRIKGPSIEVVPLPNQFEKVVDLIAGADLDLLHYWEVATDALNYFLPFVRLAPVQCTSWGIQVTSGISQLDYYLSSRLVEPENAQQHYTERLLLADTLLTYQFRTAPPSIKRDRSHWKLPSGATLFLCAQNLGKFHPDFDTMLAAILRGYPNGHLVITCDEYGQRARRLENRFQTSMPDVMDRIHWVPRQDGDPYVNLIAISDVLLDPPHFGGVNTTYDALSLGKPIVSWPSGFHRGRYTAACLRRVGAVECLADSATDYVARAIELGENAALRGKVSQQILSQADELFEDQLAVTEHERLFEWMFQANA